jgi:hypothetical protein
MSATQTTGSVSQSCGLIEISFNGTDWVDISGETNLLEQPEQARMVGEARTMAGELPIVKGGKKEAMDLVVKIIYTETDAEAYQQVRAEFEEAGCGGGTMYLRYSPAGGTADKERLTTSSAGILTSFLYPNLSAEEAGPIMAGFTLRIGGLTTTVISS